MYVCVYMCICMYVQIMMQSKKGKTCVLTELTFQSDELVCHPQTAKDCGWAMHVAGDKYQVIHKITCFHTCV